MLKNTIKRLLVSIDPARTITVSTNKPSFSGTKLVKSKPFVNALRLLAAPITRLTNSVHSNEFNAVPETSIVPNCTNTIGFLFNATTYTTATLPQTSSTLQPTSSLLNGNQLAAVCSSL